MEDPACIVRLNKIQKNWTVLDLLGEQDEKED
jgi:hypothetical protein